MENKEYFDKKFNGKYIPENSESEDDFYEFEKLESSCQDFWDCHESLLVEKGFEDIDSFINHIISELDWQYPETLMDEQINFD